MKKNTLTLAFKAGDCTFYKRRNPETGSSLEEQGILDFAKAPPDFEPDLQKLAKDPGSLAALALAIEDYDESQMRILMYALHSSHRLLKYGLRFGQAVFKNLSAPRQDYLDCWFKCYVIGLGPQIENRQYVKLTGSLDDIHGTLITSPVGSYLTRQEFNKMRSKLAAEGRLRAPKSIRSQYFTHNSPKADFDNFPTLTEVKDRLGTPVVTRKTPTVTPPPAKKPRLKTTKTRSGEKLSIV